MAYKVSGYSISGNSFRGVESFLSIPGLRLYLDARKLTVVVSGKVSSWASILDGRLFTAIDLQRPIITGNWIDFNDLTDTQSKQLRSNGSPEFNFFSNGSPFGYFEIMAYKNAATVISSRMFTTRLGSGSGANVNISGASDRLIYQIVESGTLLTGQQTGVNTLTQEVVHSIAVTRNSLSESNNLKLYIDNVVGLQTTISVGTTNNSNALTNGNFTRKRYLSGLKLLYDWTGFSSSQVEQFSSRVRAILESQKINFIYPI